MIRTFIIAVLAAAGLLAGSTKSQAVTHLLGPFSFGDVVPFGGPPTPGQGPFDNEDWVFTFTVPNGQTFPDVTIHMAPEPQFTELTLQVIRDVEPPTAPVGTPAGFTIVYDDSRTVAVGDTFVSYILRVAGDLEGLPPEYSGDFVVAVAATTPLPAALPLFATGLGALGLLGWRRKRKAQAAA
jgi:hypothetical protein